MENKIVESLIDLVKISISIIPLFIMALVPEVKENIFAVIGLGILTAVLLFGWAMNDMFKSAKSFMSDSEARKLSPFKYPNGAGMSIREAKSQGLM